MLDLSNDSEEIVIRRIQRRLDRYFAEHERPEGSHAPHFKTESSSTRIVAAPPESEFGKDSPKLATSPGQLPPPPIISPKTQEDIARVSIVLKPDSSEPSVPSLSNIEAPALSKDDADSAAPRSAGTVAAAPPPSAYKSKPPKSKKASKETLANEAPIDQLLGSDTAKGNAKVTGTPSGYVPVLLFGLALLCALGLLFGWYYFTSPTTFKLSP